VNVVNFSVSEKYSPTGKIDTVKWHFGGEPLVGDKISIQFFRRFHEAGQHFVSVTGWQDGKGNRARAKGYSVVGIAPEPDLSCAASDESACPLR